MKRLPARLAVWLGYVVVTLFTAVILKLLIVHAKWLVSEKDSIGAVSTIINSTLLLLGSLFAYLRFFHGRTFSRRLDVELDVRVIEATSMTFLHAINLTIKNIGAVPIWNATVILRIQQHGQNAGILEEISNWEEPFPISRGSVIDTQESSQFYALRQIPQEVWAVTYWVKVSASRGEAWTKAVTIANTPETARSKSPAQA